MPNTRGLTHIYDMSHTEQREWHADPAKVEKILKPFIIHYGKRMGGNSGDVVAVRISGTRETLWEVGIP